MARRGGTKWRPTLLWMLSHIPLRRPNSVRLISCSAYWQASTSSAMGLRGSLPARTSAASPRAWSKAWRAAAARGSRIGDRVCCAVRGTGDRCAAAGGCGDAVCAHAGAAADVRGDDEAGLGDCRDAAWVWAGVGGIALRPQVLRCPVAGAVAALTDRIAPLRY